MRRTPIAVVAVLLMLSACSREAHGPGDSPVAPDTSAPTNGAVPTLAQVSTPGPAAWEPFPSDPELRHAVELRRAMGLDAELEWIAAVAADPRATTELLAIPLLPEEEADVVARTVEADAVAATVNRYAAVHADEFSGLYIDHETGAGVVTIWTGHLEQHEAAIRALLEPGWRIEFRVARFSERHLRTLQDRISEDLDWLATIAARPESVGVDVHRNRAFITVSSANPDAEALIAAHYDLGDALIVESDGTGVRLVPWGEVAGRVRTDTRVPTVPVDNLLRWHGPSGLECGGGDMGFGVAPDETFTLPCQAGLWTIEVAVPSGDDWRSIGSGTVQVAPDATARLEIVLGGVP
jgi:hypothetical protein